MRTDPSTECDHHEAPDGAVELVQRRKVRRRGGACTSGGSAARAGARAPRRAGVRARVRVGAQAGEQAGERRRKLQAHAGGFEDDGAEPFHHVHDADALARRRRAALRGRGTCAEVRVVAHDVAADEHARGLGGRAVDAHTAGLARVVRGALRHARERGLHIVLEPAQPFPPGRRGRRRGAVDGLEQLRLENGFARARARRRRASFPGAHRTHRRRCISIRLARHGARAGLARV